MLRIPWILCYVWPTVFKDEKDYARSCDVYESLAYLSSLTLANLWIDLWIYKTAHYAFPRSRGNPPSGFLGLCAGFFELMLKGCIRV